MKKPSSHSPSATGGFTLVELMISMAIGVTAIGLTLGTFLFGLRTMYKDSQRLATNASLRTFMAQISKETLNASYFYLLPYYTSLDGSFDLSTDPLKPSFIAYETGEVNIDFDTYVAHGDCLVLITKTSQYRTTDIRQIRVYYRVTTKQAEINAEAPVRYYETPDTAGPGSGWGEGTAAASNGHTDIVAELNKINLKSSPTLAGSKLLTPRSKGRTIPAPYTGYSAGDRYPIFSTESPDTSTTNGFISINVEFINGSTNDTILSSSSFNYTISPRR